MKSIDLTNSSPTLSEVLELAQDGNLVLRTRDGREFVVAEIDDFEEEVAATRANPELMRLLDERSKEKGRYTLEQVKEMLKDAE